MRSQLRSGDWQTRRSGRILAHDPAHVPTELYRRGELPVWVPEERDVRDTEFGGSGTLLLSAQLGHRLTGDGPVDPPGIAVSDDAVGDLEARLHPRRHRARGAEVHVIGVSCDEEHAVRPGRVVQLHRRGLVAL